MKLNLWQKSIDGINLLITK